ncbi:MAG: nitroreductase family deazaflavin-dependent oxidoreductase, partial [Actinomycetota bacterium]|nr:nitroreductase family deazaflavin-dependent oxidoreductase [Actinomycetota bacterium]
MTAQLDEARPEVFGDEGPLRNRFHTQNGARLINRFTRPLWTALPPAGFGVLTTTGRRTGLLRRQCVRVVVRDGSAFVVSIVGEDADWLRNVRQNPRVRLRARRATANARA